VKTNNKTAGLTFNQCQMVRGKKKKKKKKKKALSNKSALQEYWFLFDLYFPFHH
jgi:hypothetical protein